MQVGGGGRGKGVVQSGVERGGGRISNRRVTTRNWAKARKKEGEGRCHRAFFYRTKLSFSLLLSFLLLDHCRIVKSDGPSRKNLTSANNNAPISPLAKQSSKFEGGRRFSLPTAKDQIGAEWLFDYHALNSPTTCKIRTLLKSEMANYPEKVSRKSLTL